MLETADLPRVRHDSASAVAGEGPQRGHRRFGTCVAPSLTAGIDQQGVPEQGGGGATAADISHSATTTPLPSATSTGNSSASTVSLVLPATTHLSTQSEFSRVMAALIEPE